MYSFYLTVGFYLAIFGTSSTKGFGFTTSSVNGFQNHWSSSKDDSGQTSLRQSFDDLYETVPLSEVIQDVNSEKLFPSDRQNIIQASINLIEGVNPNFNIRNRFLGINPVSELRSFSGYASSISNFAFHSKMKKIFNSMRNGHTVYIPPLSLLGVEALLGFLVEPFLNRKTNQMEFIVSEKIDFGGFKAESLKVGFTVQAIDGVPTKELAMKLGRDRGAGNNASQLRFGTGQLTVRNLGFSSIPEREVASITYVDLNGKQNTTDIPWVYLRLKERSQLSSVTRNSLLNPLFSHHSLQQTTNGFAMEGSLKRTNHALHTSKRTIQIVVPEYLRSYYEAAVLGSDDDSIGYLAVRSFTAPNTSQALNDLRTIVSKFPRNGMVIDIRGNPGGQPYNVYGLARTFSNVTIGRFPVVYRATRFSLKLFSEASSSAPFTQVFEDAVKLGVPFTGPSAYLLGPLPFIYDSDVIPEIDGLGGPVYDGPVVVIADGATASAGDMLASICRDYGICYLINVDGSTAGTGDVTYSYSYLRSFANNTLPYEMPLGIDLRSANGRFFRSGRYLGALVSFVGVEPDEKYDYTRKDILNDDFDLVRKVRSQLLKMKR